MEAQADSGAAEPLRDREFQKLLKSSSSASLTTEASHNASGEYVGTPAHHGSQVLITEKRQPLSSVSSLEVHFDLLDLTELTDMSDQELGEVFADSDEENQTESPAIHPSDRQQPPLPRFPHGGYVRSPSWTRGGKAEQQSRDRKHHSDSENTEPMLKIERSQSQQP
ncbi:dysbindin domain-containing protein 1 isoform X1 [Carassius auratus]|uniref:Dysbindin domain-containing protein 1 n=1 Tax=Carassius auratus TaxID=7957 RepID=A0A6P6MG56_CARAU|nr:dysbindin domain-containing protein 1-like isoform X1 [Carassius auratus]XP_052400124.1 dysbindin domain-containing protein 1 isoform X1 [Carassius gibelio]